MEQCKTILSGFQRLISSGIFAFLLVGLMGSPALAIDQVGLYDMWETQVINSKSYSNPFNYSVIELQATFTSPNGKKVNFFGFYDGNGKGGQSGNVWKLRFMPDKVGTWHYTYRWTDGTPGRSGSFSVLDKGLPGPLKVDNNGTNSWYFKDSRGKPFHFRGYDLHGVMYDNQHVSPRVKSSIVEEESRIRKIIDTDIVAAGYNLTMVTLAGDRKKRRSDVFGNRSFWINSSDTKRFDLPVWHTWERLIKRMGDKHVYAMTFVSMLSQQSEYGFSDFKVFLRYWVARFGPFYNLFGWNPTWEWTDIWSASEVNQIMSQAANWDPFPHLLSVHDCSQSNFSGWLDFSMRQANRPGGSVRNIFEANSRTMGQQQGSCNSVGGVAKSFLDKPIVGSEDIWEAPGGHNGNPRNATEVRRAAWGILMAGVMPLYSEWSPWVGGNGKGESEIRRMFDFYYSKTNYRQYKQLNHLVSKSARQIASGTVGQEYLVYDENGGTVTINLSDAGSSKAFSVL